MERERVRERERGERGGERKRGRDLWMEDVRRIQAYAPWIGVIKGVFRTRECLLAYYA